MKISTLALLALSGFQSVAAVTLAINGFSGSLAVRQDITVMKNAGPIFDLYILALKQFQDSKDITSTQSWYQIAGIHGLPQVPWDGESGTDNGIGFCTHGSILFPTWHRPYVAVYEQTIWNIVQNISQQFPENVRDSYVQAGKTFRVPYWDWSMNSTMPDFVNNPKITINTPQGVQTIKNPLFSYTWPNNDVGKAGTDTFRATDAQSNLAGSAAQFHQLVYNMLTSVPRFDFFADANTIDLFPSPGGIIISPNFRPKATWSVESIHNTIHNTIGGLFGGQGTMGDLTIAAFDPVFWLHHTNVDRVFAMWQAIYPDSYLEPFTAGQDSWWFSEGDMQDSNTPLVPFHSNDDSANHTSLTVRSISNFGYTYPELQSSTRAADVRTLINKKYNPLGQVPGGFAAGQFNCNLSLPVCQRSVSTAPVSLSNAADYQWVISMNINESMFNETITIGFFFDSPSGSPSSWPTDPSVVAVQPIMNKGSNSKSNQDKIITRTVFITHALINELPDLKETTVLPFLQKKLQWRATWKDGSVIDAATMKKLEAVSVVINVQPVEQTPDQPDAFPIYGDWSSHGFSVLGANGDFIAGPNGL